MAASESDDIVAIVNEIRDRVRSRHPSGEVKNAGVVMPDLLPLLHARDAAAAKVAAIGSVNPRPPGLANNIIQSVKRTVARALGWFVRDQIEFNRSVLVALETTLEVLNDTNRALSATAGAAEDLRDMRTHWLQWREEWEEKLLRNEVHYLKGLSELQASFDLRLTHTDANYRDSVRQQHTEFTASVQKAIAEVQSQFWSDFTRMREEYERLIHAELRVIRQKQTAAVAPSSAVTAPADAPLELELDYARFSDRFRGNEEYVRERQSFYLPFFSGRKSVLDIGCGRGEFLELMRDAGVPARGLDLDPESVALCRSKGLTADVADLFQSLPLEPDGAFDGIFASQVVEHLTPAQVPQFVKLCASKLRTGGVLALETPNPECLAIFATHFYLDPTHHRPIPPPLLVFYFEEFGLGNIEVHRLSPAAESMPSLNELPPAFRDAFFGGLDYGIIGRKL